MVRQRTASIPQAWRLAGPALTPAWLRESCYAPAYPGIFSRSILDPSRGQQQQRIRVELVSSTYNKHGRFPGAKVPVCLPRSLHLSTSLWTKA